MIFLLTLCSLIICQGKELSGNSSYQELHSPTAAAPEGEGHGPPEAALSNPRAPATRGPRAHHT